MDTLVRQLVTGFETLQTEYQKLFTHCEGLERKLVTAREQVSLKVHYCRVSVSLLPR